jgi:uncharacterized membrane protein YgaE (UPF0421/DUF939 family)
MGRATGEALAGTGGRVRRRVEELLSSHPYVFVAVKSAVAAGLAWTLVQPLGGAADDYPYYAPLGAVVVMSTSAMTSVRTSVQAVVAIFLGAALAGVGLQLPVPSVVAVMAVVGFGTGLSVWRRLGTMGVWVPFAALFVLILGGRDPWQYVLGYAGLTGLGALVGVGINLLAPQLPLGRTLHALSALRHELGHQLRTLADAISSESDLSVDSERITSVLQPQTRYLEGLVAEVREARRVNWRAGRWQEVVDEREQQARALERIAYLVEEIAALVSRSSTTVMAGSSELGEAVAEALRCTAVMVEAGNDAYEEDEDGRSPFDDARRDVAKLRRLVLRSHGSAEDDDADADADILIGASVAVSLERAVEAWS